MKRHINKSGTVSFRAESDVFSYLEKQRNKSEFLNRCVRESMRKNKSNLERLRDMKKMQRLLAKKMEELYEGIQTIQDNLSEEEAEQYNAEENASNKISRSEQEIIKDELDNLHRSASEMII
jgi:acetyl-CoA carboxylase carboxyltransferase component